jgi:hypothetical protein
MILSTRPGRQNRQSVLVTSTQRGNVELIRRALDSDPDALADKIVWHFQSPHPELVTHFEGKDKVLKDWPRMLDDLTDGTFNKRAVDIWPVGEDLVVAHLEIEMTIGDVAIREAALSCTGWGTASSSRASTYRACPS